MSQGRDQQPHPTYDEQGCCFVRHFCSKFQRGKKGDCLCQEL